jgi:hypothetical protein
MFALPIAGMALSLPGFRNLPGFADPVKMR